MERRTLMHYLKDPIVVALLMLVSLGALKWAGRTIVEAIANSKRTKVVPCECGRLVYFQPPLQLPTKADLYAAAGTITAAMSAAEGIPIQGGQIVLEEIPPGAPLVELEGGDGLEPCSKAKPCSFCVHGRVLCVVCRADLGCALRPNPLRCSGCAASGSIPDADLVLELPSR